MSVATSNSYKRKKSLVFEEIDGQIHLLDDKKDAIVTLNETASLLWKELVSKKTSQELAEILAKKFGIEIDEALKDTNDFIREMLKLGLLEH